MDQRQLDELTGQADRDGVAQLVVGAVIGHNDHVLLLKRPADDFMGGIFELPSGKVEPDEHLDDALAREVKEETGLDLAAITAYLGSFDYISGSGKPSRQFNFAIEVTAPEPVELTEHDDYQWAQIDDEPPVTDAVKTVLSTYRDTRAA